MKGTKNDSGKLRYDLIPWFGHKELARVFTIGAKKYGDSNWRGGFKWGRVVRALQSHFEKWRSGEKYDLEDGQLHLSSVAWCAYVLMEFEQFKIGEDDRIKYVIPKNHKTKTSFKRKKMQKVLDSISTPKANTHRRPKAKRHRV